ncbi:secretion protein HlyD [Candidatus Koribacter versatilis Ellin345]|uniref:Secretion protein HlyD n=1 Tax=Koribacter versatilis (strain Ellin345) TaxID=204669 RepID=Q1IM04_KORVE|nr:HlyD family secretion protein [Candidatus Koribacter versatilis]ABF42096.1 secretion protein HlyD [Candidatus Koribacter versatilis Ellin345]
MPEVKNQELEKPKSAREEEHHDPETERPERPRSFFQRNPAARWIFLLVLIALIVGAVFVWRYYTVRESTDDAQIDGHLTPISSRVSGTVVTLNVTDNQVVNAGDLIVQLDPKDYEVALSRVKADLGDAIATAEGARTSVPITTISTGGSLDTAKANLAASKKDVDAASARVVEAQANYDKLSKDLERAKMLVQKDEISRQQYDSAVAAEQAAKATVDAAQAQFAASQSHVAQAQAQLQTAGTAPQQVLVSRSRVGSAEAQVQRQQAAVNQAQLNLGYTAVRAPANGIISNRTVEVGQTVSPGQPLAALIDLDDVWVTANFKEDQLKKMKIGQKVKIHVDAFDKDFDGHLDSFAGASGARFSLLPPENATGNYVKVVQRLPVKIVFEKGQDPQHMLRPGLSVVPTVLTDSK